ncbi:transmembrane prolyl 4-hydroxylase isoform X2 [Hydra vulgaris]|uniref:Transmembrane prolyl 4-hydroxylase isoform X2 n=1 Tax=Hydra vulgaris TaxID=6087 RepID=A0ABM4C6J1_HYDVU
MRHFYVYAAAFILWAGFNNCKILTIDKTSINENSQISDYLPLSGLFAQSNKYQCKIKGDIEACKKEELINLSSKDKKNKVFGPRFQKVHLALARRELKEVGYSEEINFNGKKMIMKILSLKPFLFEVSNFLDKNETELIIDLALEKGLKAQDPRPAFVNLPEKITQSIFDRWDSDFNGHLSLEEVYSIPELNSLYLSFEDIIECIKDSGLDKDKDDYISYGELANGGLKNFKNRIFQWESEKQQRRINNTRQTWLWHDEDELLAYENLFEDFHERISHLTGIPTELISESEPLQVTTNEIGSFSHCQYDSSNNLDNQPCCVYGKKNCRMCRYLTMRIFLKDAESGGEVVFPLADNHTFSWNDLKQDTIKKCEKVPSSWQNNLVIKPKPGSAIFYYNHEISPYTGWLGEMEPKVLSGITLVSKGELWSAKMWINIIGDGVNELRGWRSGSNFLSTQNLNHALIEKMRNDYFREGERYLHYYKTSYKRTENEKNDEKNDISFFDSSSLPLQSKLIKNKNQTTNEKVLTIQEKIGIMKKYAEEGEGRRLAESVKTSGNMSTNFNTEINKNESLLNKSSLKDENKIKEPIRPDPLPTFDKFSILNSKKENELPFGPPKRTINPDPHFSGKVIENRLVKASLILIEELERDELEIIARNIHDKLQLACIPLIVNPIGN